MATGTTTLAEKAQRAAHSLSVTAVNPKAFVVDVYEALAARGDVARGELVNFKHWLVAMHRRGILTLSRCDMAPAFDPIKVEASTTKWWDSEFHFIEG